ncbi:hypothetical protein [Microvirga massiliensis]|uniref:hypothetical protein n=1 Tax=Microvirga massiliensis TaxID=1033741 RepID=UPI00062B4ADD|nr:hypothetical protein [Microvirga massiliensis]
MITGRTRSAHCRGSWIPTSERCVGRGLRLSLRIVWLLTQSGFWLGLPDGSDFAGLALLGFCQRLTMLGHSVELLAGVPQ